MWRFNRDIHKRIMQNSGGKRDLVYHGVKMDCNDNKSQS